MRTSRSSRAAEAGEETLLRYLEPACEGLLGGRPGGAVSAELGDLLSAVDQGALSGRLRRVPDQGDVRGRRERPLGLAG